MKTAHLLLPEGLRHDSIHLPELPWKHTDAELEEFMWWVEIAMKAEAYFCMHYKENWVSYQLQFTPELHPKVSDKLFGTQGLNWIVDNFNDDNSTVRIHHLWEYMLSDPSWGRKVGSPQYGISDCALVANKIEKTHRSATLKDIRRAIMHRMQIAFWSGESQTNWTAIIPEEIKAELTDAGFDVFKSSRYACSISYVGFNSFHRNGLLWLVKLLEREMKRCQADKLPLSRFKVSFQKKLSTEQKAFLKKLHFRVYGSTIRLPKNFMEILDGMVWPMPQDALDGAVMAHRLSGKPVCIYTEEPPLYNELMEHFFVCLKGNIRPEHFCFMTNTKLPPEYINHLRVRNFDVVSDANNTTIKLFQHPVHAPMSYFDGSCLAHILRENSSPLYNELVEHFFDCLKGNVRPEQFCFATTKKLSLEDILQLRFRNFDVVCGANYTTIKLFLHPIHDPISHFDGSHLASILRENFSTKPADILLMLETLVKMQNHCSSIYHNGTLSAEHYMASIQLDNVVISNKQMTSSMMERFPGGVIIPTEPLTSYLKEHGWEINMSVGPFDPKNDPYAAFLGWSIFSQRHS